MQLMGILNATPNSFSDGGQFFSQECFRRHLRKWLAHKEAPLLDIGVESTAPFNPALTFNEEKKRLEEIVFPVLCSENLQGKTLSFDTYRLETFDYIYHFCAKSLPHNKIIWNDVAGLLEQDLFVQLKSRYKNIDYILGHSYIPQRSETSEHMHYVRDGEASVLADVIAHFRTAQAWAEEYQLTDRVYFDPCFGFSKNMAQNIDLLKNLDRLMQSFSREQRWLLGVSRKSFLQKLVATNQNMPAEVDALQEVIILRESLRLAGHHLTWRVHSLQASSTTKLMHKIYH